jgi:hypothetical protein
VGFRLNPAFLFAKKTFFLFFKPIFFVKLVVKILTNLQTLLCVILEKHVFSAKTYLRAASTSIAKLRLQSSILEFVEPHFVFAK